MKTTPETESRRASFFGTTRTGVFPSGETCIECDVKFEDGSEGVMQFDSFYELNKFAKSCGFIS